MNKIKLVVVGGVAGGASCAARARRLSEEAEIILIERGAYVSFANCGLPYYIGNVIKKEDGSLNTYETLKKAVDGAEYLLKVHRREVDWQAARRGTVQHEIFEGEMATPFEQDAESIIQVNCRDDAG